MIARSCSPPLLAAALILGGCVVLPPRPVQHESRVVERDAAERVKVNLTMGAGSMKVRGGARKLVEAEFTYTDPSSRPMVTYRSTGALGTLAVEQPESGGAHGGNSRYEWDMALNDQVPMDFTAHFGAGEARLDLGGLTLRNVEVHMGAGRLDLDLRGSPQRDYGVEVHGGVGEANVRLPGDAALYVEASGGIGAVNTRGLRREGGHWVNDGAREGAAHIRVSIHGGIGAINVIAE
jgi:hypothetical protein